MTMKIGVIWCIITIPSDEVVSLTDVMMVMTSDLDHLRRGRKNPQIPKEGCWIDHDRSSDGLKANEPNKFMLFMLFLSSRVGGTFDLLAMHQ